MNSQKNRLKESKPLKYSFNNIQIVDGSIDLDDRPKKTRHEVRGIRIAVPFISNLRYYVDRYVQPSFAAVVNGKEVSLKGRTKPFSESLETTFDINISDLDIPHYLEYVPLQREYEIPSAFLDVKAVVSFTQHKDKPPTLRAEGDVILKDVRVSGKDKSPMVRLPMVKAVIFPSDLAARDFHLAALQVQDPEIDVSIDRNGTLKLLTLIPEKQKESEVEEKGKKIAPNEEPGNRNQKFTVDSIRLTGGKVRFADASMGSPFKTALGELRIDMNGLGTGKESKAEALVSFSTEAGETVELKGNLSLSPLASEGTIAVAKAILKKYAPYYSDSVRFDIHGGSLDARSGYSFAEGEEGPEFRLSGFHTNPPPPPNHPGPQQPNQTPPSYHPRKVPPQPNRMQKRMKSRRQRSEKIAALTGSFSWALVLPRDAEPPSRSSPFQHERGRFICSVRRSDTFASAEGHSADRAGYSIGADVAISE